MKETLKIQYFIDFLSKQTNQTFFLFYLLSIKDGFF